jgi:iron complex transport system substrate-binding protein
MAFYPRLSLRRPGIFMNDRAKGSGDNVNSKKYMTFCELFPVLFLSIFLIPFTLIPASHAEAPDRIITLAPSMTEIMFAVGLDDRIVGVTNFCDYPEEAKSKPKIGGMSNPSLEAVVSLKPDIVLMTTDGNPKEFEQRLRAMNIKTYVFRARTIAQLPDGIRQLGEALDEKERFNILASDIEESLKGFRTKRIAGGRKVLFMVWPEPLMVAGPGTAIHDAINLIGAVNIAADAKIQYPKYSIEEIVRRSPEVIFIGKAAGMDMQQTARGFLERISYIPAVKDRKVYYVSDHLYRLGPRIIPGMQELAEYLEGSKDSSSRENKIKN